ncbi:nucleotidyl transferase AbiEii/AbiGii toxin family protein [Micromonospora sonchi]|uniref:nucleotidyl transferase AbiEii/AbiGii toxin family protein n=1 Tax=Micromonospora sonchi TaxID=1763543 RepID=UPI001666A977|nr:nucleotidyl transferase AbiEii/AbiGii toxin family protein [Micromonospora sonchi]
MLADDAGQTLADAGGADRSLVAGGAPVLAVQRAPWVDAESEFRMGTAAHLEPLIEGLIRDVFGLKAQVSLGGGAGVAAGEQVRGVHDLDLRVDVGGLLVATNADERARAKQQRQDILASIGSVIDASSITDTTVRGTYSGVEVSVTLAPVPTESRRMPVIQEGGWAADEPTVPLRVVTADRAVTDKIKAFSGRTGADRDEKRARDAVDIAALLRGRPIPQAAEEIWTAMQKDPKGPSSLRSFPQDWRRLSKLAPEPGTSSADDGRMTGLPLLAGDVLTIMEELTRYVNDCLKESRKAKKTAPAAPPGGNAPSASDVGG